MILPELSDKEKKVLQHILAGKKLSGPECRGIDSENVYMHVQPPGQCAICGNPQKFISFSRGYKNTCGAEACNIEWRRRLNRNNFVNANQNRTTRVDHHIREYIVYRYSVLGETCQQIANHISESYSFVRKIVSEKGLTKTYRDRRTISKVKHLYPKFSDKRFRAACQQYTAKELAKRLGCSPNFVITEMHKHGDRLKRSSVSSLERSLLSSLEKHIRCESNNRTLIAPYELDIIIPEHKVAIEINGSYFHSKHDKGYHLKKTEMCQSVGYHLFHISDNMILNKKDIVLSMILNKCNLSNRKIYGRNTEIRSVSNLEYREFLNTNHIQGYCGARIKLGLYYGDELVSVMSFSKPRFNRKYDFEMIRFCTKLNTRIVGGASKLFSHFLQTNHNPSCISYCSRTLFNGKFHETLGFTLSHVTPPGYNWINEHECLSRYQCQPHKLNTNLTENEYMRSRGYNKVYDCGQLVFVYK